MLEFKVLRMAGNDPKRTLNKYENQIRGWLLLMGDRVTIPTIAVRFTIFCVTGGTLGFKGDPGRNFVTIQ